MLVEKQGLSLKQRGKIYQCCVRPVLLYCCETWKRTVVGEARLCRAECRLIRMMCGVRLVVRVSTDVLRIGWCCKDQRYNSKPSAVVWLCHPSRY